jgi:hypothetical protein
MPFFATGGPIAGGGYSKPGRWITGDPRQADLAQGVNVSLRDRWIALVLAVAGIGVCLMSLGTFFMTIHQNTLPWYKGLSAREHYVAVGQSYSHGFAIGFFLCFFLTLIAMAVGSWVRDRTEARRAENNAPHIVSGGQRRAG